MIVIVILEHLSLLVDVKLELFVIVKVVGITSVIKIFIQYVIVMKEYLKKIVIVIYVMGVNVLIEKHLLAKKIFI